MRAGNYGACLLGGLVMVVARLRLGGCVSDGWGGLEGTRCLALGHWEKEKDGGVGSPAATKCGNHCYQLIYHVPRIPTHERSIICWGCIPYRTPINGSCIKAAHAHQNTTRAAPKTKPPNTSKNPAALAALAWSALQVHDSIEDVPKRCVVRRWQNALETCLPSLLNTPHNMAPSIFPAVRVKDSHLPLLALI